MLSDLEQDVALYQALDMEYDRAIEKRQIAWTSRYQSVRQLYHRTRREKKKKSAIAAANVNNLDDGELKII